ncbi:ABC transporter substrate-binding protein [Streptococcus thoraltensis]|uniref:ABC transporter substrate-binding protein n=1 Tax=Streptococcus thoraltensis TaxID=55085 RepID=UPI002A82DDEE|nr:ABC transporter substrate-binding protein [Streptococcus thoraltensis]MDY4761919.1 ABC transporter substrate-binding protein [Streptococcus thoraltensis]
MKNNFKKILTLTAALLTLAGCSQASDASKDAKHIGILQYVEFETLDVAREGFVDELAKEGYKDGKNIVIDYQNSQGDQANLQSISEKLVKDNDLVLGIATPAAQALTTASSDVPVTFTAVTDPLSAKLVKSMKKPGGNATGTTDMAPTEERVALLKKVMPNLKKVGIMYTTNERNSEVQVKEAKKVFKKEGIEVVAKGISSTNDVQDTTRSLMNQTEVLYMPTDNLIDSSITLVTDLSKEMKIPVYAANADLVEKGALFSYGPDFEELGRQTARQAIKILEGKKVSQVPVESPQNLTVKVNDEMAKLLNIDMSAVKDKK